MPVRIPPEYPLDGKLAQECWRVMRLVADEVSSGATFSISGPDPASCPKYFCQLESKDGRKLATAHAEALPALLVQLGDEWAKRQ